MHVVYVITRGDVIGGASMHVLHLASAMAQKQVQVSVVTGSDGPVASMARDRGFSVYIEPSLVRAVRPWLDLLCVWRLRRLFKQLKPDLVHLHSAKACTVGRLASWWAGYPSVVTIHGWPFASAHGFMRWLYCFIEKRLLRITSGLVLVCNKDLSLAYEQLGSLSLKHWVIHNGIPDTGYNGQPKPTQDCVRIISVARFEQPKDQQLLVRALAELKLSNWTLRLVGDGPELVSVQRLAEQLQIAGQIEFCGERHDVSDLLRQADLFVLCSRWESLPISIIEAMRAGLAVISSDVGGVKELVVHEKTGLLVPPSDLPSLKQALQRLIANAELRTEWGCSARIRFDAYFSLAQMAEATLGCYQQVQERS